MPMTSSIDELELYSDSDTDKVSIPGKNQSSKNNKGKKK